jgi:N-methylhydantoinase A
MRALVMSLRTAVIGRRRPINLDRLAGTTTPTAEPIGTRRVWFETVDAGFETVDVSPNHRRGGLGGAAGAPQSEKSWHETPIYRRENLALGTTLEGPAIVEQLDTTTVIEPGDRARVDALGNLEITVRGV